MTFAAQTMRKFFRKHLTQADRMRSTPPIGRTIAT